MILCVVSKLNDPMCGEVRLTANITNHAGTCINDPVNFTNKIFDCQGFTIHGSITGERTYEVYLKGKNYTTIRNCVITRFTNGILFVQSLNNNIINNKLNRNSYGIYLINGSNDNKIINNIVNRSGFDGIILEKLSSRNALIGNLVNNSGYNGIMIEGYSYENIVINNTISFSGFSGIFLLGFISRTLLFNNTILYNAYWGIELSIRCDDNNITSNKVMFNGYDGVRICLRCLRNRLMNNTFCHNNQANGDYYDIKNDNITNIGANNICNTTFNYNDTDAIGCRFRC